MTLKEFHKATRHLSDTAEICYHAYDKGCCLTTYSQDDWWIFDGKVVVLNPGPNYDPRRPTARAMSCAPYQPVATVVALPPEES